MKFKAPMLRSDLCDSSNGYIFVKGTITVADPNNDAYEKKLPFKNNAPFVSCISKIINTLIDNATNLDILMSMYNLLDYSKNCSKTTGRLRNYHRDELNSGAVGNINYSIKDSKYFDYKTSISGQLEGDSTEIEMLKLLCH